MTFIRGIITKLYENILERIAFFCMFYGQIISKNNVSVGGMERLMSEAKILSELDHVNIVKFSRVWESETKIFIVMELLLGGTLRQLMSEKKKNNEWFTEIESAQIMHSILSGVAYFHSKSIVHRDLKPGNISRFCLDLCVKIKAIGQQRVRECNSVDFLVRENRTKRNCEILKNS